MPMELHDNELSSVIDLTAMILVNMKNDSTPPPSPVPSPIHSVRSGSPTSLQEKNEQCDCMLCSRPAPHILVRCHTWAWIMRVVFFSLRDRFPEKKFFSLKNDVYEYMMNHWGVLGLDRKPSANWHKQIQDMLSHSRNIFESGMTHFKQNGFWRLKDLEDPWTARPDAPRPPSTTPPQTPLLSPRKRGWKNGEEEEEAQATLKKLCTPPTSPRLSLGIIDSPISTPFSTPCSTPSSTPSSSPESSNPLAGAGDDSFLEKEVAILREQLHSMTESIAALSTESPTSTPIYGNPLQQFAVFSHNRVWEEGYSFQQQYPIGPVLA